MLQSVSDQHDEHYEDSQRDSIEALVAARNDGKKHLLLAASGSVATIKSKSKSLPPPRLPRGKIPVIIQALAKYAGALSIRVVLTESATHFLQGQSAEQPTVSSLLHMPNVDAVYRDRDEWGPQPWRRGASILHIELRRWADILVVAPLSANTLAKIVNGMSDNLLTSVIRAWDTDASVDMKKKLIVVAPAMNTAMWRNPITQKQISVLVDDWGVKEEECVTGQTRWITGWFQVITPTRKTLACGDTGDQSFYNTGVEEIPPSDGANPLYTGAMASVPSICAVIEERLGLGPASSSGGNGGGGGGGR
ncbi:9a1e7e3a-72ba-4f3b-88bd-cbb563c9dfac [Thermothielavioides terrestris]|uniref:9a1e7e3a-72ba-4f3b-88bd-cbb563c9dfac n=1 Tax=Thermothielavioides terrestris TaxID=2587410 RepID=A0A3S4ARA2_9PEZI|nr:9a1e7e3a-72ba-4f3b-88bd-cbb563c9dfac [Thermothielavioides terrestris]